MDMKREKKGTHKIIVPALILAAVTASILANGPHPYYRMAKSELSMAVMSGNADEVKKALAGGADVNGTEADGRKMAPLHFAVGMNNLVITQLLIDKGARVNIQDGNGSTPLHYLVMGTSIPEDADVRFLVEKGADIALKNHDGDTSLHGAAGYARPETLEFLVKKSGAVNVKNGRGWTPLHSAVHCENVENTGVLLKNGADPAIRDNTGNTAADLIAKKRTKYGSRSREAGEYEKVLDSLKRVFSQYGK